MPMILNNPFINHFTEHLPADPVINNYTRQVEHAAFSYVTPTKVRAPKLIAFEQELLASLNLNIEEGTLTQLVSGNHLFAEMKPYAMCYGGHQFGQWAQQLGDGRAINLGEIKDKQGQLKTLQLKGAGLTPYSRTADGLAVLRSSVREFLCSEAMFHLGVPTTRALALSLTGEQVVRDMFYDGNADYESGAVVCRVSSSFLRFGSFQLPHYRNDKALIKQIADYCITTHFPHLGKPSADTYLAWFKEICLQTADLIVHWMRVGFVHGVMNTDNMSILAETIDYGPYGWIDNYDLNWTPNTTDSQMKRYRFGSQGAISQWNLYQLANALYPLIQRVEPLQEIIDNYSDIYSEKYHSMMLAKLGLTKSKQADKAEDAQLIEQLEQALMSAETDMTIFFRQLATLPIDSSVVQNHTWLDYLSTAFYQLDDLSEQQLQVFCDWLGTYIERSMLEEHDSQTRQQRMNQVNPKYVLRNYLAQQAIDLANKQDFSMIHELQQVMRKPYDEQPEFERYAQKRPLWAKSKPGCSMLSCSS